jgi:HEAT repeat protein
MTMMSERDFNELLARVKEGGRATEAELAEVLHALEARGDEVDPYTLLHIIGKTGDRRFVPIVKRYLTAGTGDRESEDDMLRRIAVKVLGQWWKVREVFEPIARSAFSDPSPFVRQVAASALGELGSEHPDLKSASASLLLKGLERYGQEERSVWGAFYEGILILAGVPPSRWPARPDESAPEKLDRDILEEVRRLALVGGGHVPDQEN